MNQLDGLIRRVKAAGENREALDKLISEYLPFLKKQAAATEAGLEYDDRLSLAMLTFARCAMTYQEERGSFLGYASVCIRNRILDEARRHGGSTVTFFPGCDAEASEEAFHRAEEREFLAEEIDSLAGELEEWAITFRDLARLCPRHEDARQRCMALARLVSSDPLLRSAFLTTRRLPQGELSRRSGLSVKTIEKHRKYIVALIVILLGDYPYIRFFLHGLNVTEGVE